MQMELFHFKSSKFEKKKTRLISIIWELIRHVLTSLFDMILEVLSTLLDARGPVYYYMVQDTRVTRKILHYIQIYSKFTLFFYSMQNEKLVALKRGNKLYAENIYFLLYIRRYCLPKSDFKESIREMRSRKSYTRI